VIGGQQLPSLWDPQEFFLHLLLWAGLPAIAVAVITAILAAINGIKGWIQFGHAAKRGTTLAGQTFRTWTTNRQRAVMRLLLQSLLAVAFSYMLAVVLNAGIELAIANGKQGFSLKEFESEVGIAAWPPAAVWTVIGGIGAIATLALAYMTDLRGVQSLVKTAGVLVLIAVWIVFLWLGTAAVCMWLGALIDAASTRGVISDPVPIPLAITSTITALLAGVLILVVPKIPTTSKDAFAPVPYR
jgi:hypothetical protein